MRIRRAVLPLLVVPLFLAACGDGDGDGDGDRGAGDGDRTASATPTQREEPDDLDACEVLTSEEVSAAVGTPVGEGIASSGPAVTGGSFTTCLWQSVEPGGQALLTIYPNAAAADSARGEDDPDVEDIGDKAYSSTFSSVWVYLGERSFLAQWYTFGSTDDEDLPQSVLLARAAVEALG